MTWEDCRVIGVTKASDGVALFVVRRILESGESVLRCYEHLTFPPGLGTA